MIEAVGHSEDGKVWISILAVIDKDRKRGVWMIDPEKAREIVKSLNKSIEMAEQVQNGRNSANTH